jgi:hypothetical protein
MSSLANQQQNLSFPGLLQVPGGITSALQQVQDGDGNATGLSLSSTGASVTTSSTFQASINGTTIVGALPRLISDGFGDMPSVKDFGAVGNGVTDDTAAFTAAIAASPLGASIPAGSYKITGTITGIFYSFGVVTIVTGTVNTISNLASLGASTGSTFVGTTTGGTGSVTRTTAAKLNDIVSVKDFGAVGNGVADDAISFQNALNYASTNNKTLFIPAGEYKCAAAITQTDLSVTIIGDGLDDTVIRFTNAASAGFDLTFRAQGVGRAPDVFTISNLTVESDCAFMGDMISAIWSTHQATASPSIFVENVRVTSRENTLLSTFGKGIYIYNAFNGFMKNVWVLGNDARTPSIGIMLQASVGIKCLALDVNRTQTGIKIFSDTAENQCEGITVASSFFYDVSYGVWAQKTLHTFITDTHTNINGASAGTSVLIQDSAQSHLIGGLIYSGGAAGNPSGQCGVNINGCNTVHLVGNTIVDTGSALTSNNILINGLSIDCVITDNYVGGGTTSIYFTASGDSRNTLANNRLSPNFVDNGANNFISGNYVGSTGNIPELRWAAAGLPAFLTASGSDTNIGIDIYPKGSGNTRLWAGGAVKVQATVAGFEPLTDNTLTLGSALARWSVVYAGTGTINTSDEREKQDIKDLSTAEKQVAVAIKGLIKSFRFKEAVAQKGNKARIHFGVMAQQVGQAFKDANLNPDDYALFCYDEWKADAGVEAGNRYGIRYDELLAFVIAAL